MPGSDLIVVVGTLGYLATSLSFAVLTLLMLFAWMRRNGSGLWVLACLFSAFWGAALGLQAAGVPLSRGMVFAVEALRPGSYSWPSFWVV